MRIHYLPIAIAALLAHPIMAEKTNDTPAPPSRDTPREPVFRDASVMIAGTSVPYRVTAAETILKTDAGKPRASIFHISYIRKDIEDATSRPVMFCFNGGPGSSSVWLHLGGVGPQRIELPGDGTTAPVPPVRLRENPQSILDVCDLVFVDPVSTGLSRVEEEAGKKDDFHGLEGDIDSMGDFVRRWITENQRWASPKFLLGESYGGIRVAGLSQSLQTRFGMNLNGTILLSSLLDFRTIVESPGSDLSYQVFLPAFAATARHHGKIEGSTDEVVAAARALASGDYAVALLKGSDLPKAELHAMAERLAHASGLPASVWAEHRLRVTPWVFRRELLREQGLTLGRFDARVAWETTDPASRAADYDPSYSLIHGAFSTAMLDFLTRELGWDDHRNYEILTGKVHPWEWNSNNRIVNVGDRLARAIRDNPHLRVLVMAAHTDLATPPDGILHSIRHLPGLQKSAAANIEIVEYASGHMFYLNPPDLEKMRADLLRFITAE
ncbi:MAG: S10 family peptidase [Luteolibacter sp.]